MSGRGTRVVFDLSGLSVTLSGLDDPLVAAFREHWRPFVVPAAAGPSWLAVEVEPSGLSLQTRPAMRPSMTRELDRGATRFSSDVGSIELAEEGIATALLAEGEPTWRFWGLVNLLTAAVAFRLPSRPGVLLHAAGIVIDGRAFVLTGASGSGKSTFALAARSAGARVVSDDTIVLDASSREVELLGTPIRAHTADPGGPGRWPVAAILHARWGAPASVGPVEPLAAHARLVANLPYMGVAWGRDARLDEVASLLTGRVRQRELTFSPDPSFVEVLREVD